MSSLASLVGAHGIIAVGDQGDDVTVLQIALRSAGYRIAVDGDFGPGTLSAVKRFQAQHGLLGDGKVGPLTAAMLDAPHESLVETAKPVIVEIPATSYKWPMDDTASLVAFYGDPRRGLAEWESSNVVVVEAPFPIYYEGRLQSKIRFHRKAADALAVALGKIEEAAQLDHSVLKHVTNYSGSGNFRPVRGSSRLSTHAFWAAIDFDAEHLPLGKGVSVDEMPAVVVDAFKSTGAFWGGDYAGRKDPMHFQYAHE